MHRSHSLEGTDDTLVLRPGAAHGYCIGLITPAILAGPIAVRSTQFGEGISRIVHVLWRKRWVEDFCNITLVFPLSTISYIVDVEMLRCDVR